MTRKRNGFLCTIEHETEQTLSPTSHDSDITVLRDFVGLSNKAPVRAHGALTHSAREIVREF